jgi:hypothetical protein
MNGNRYQVLVGASETDANSKGKLDTELLDASMQLTQAYLEVSLAAPPIFENAGKDLRMALQCKLGNNVNSEELIQYQLRMLRLNPDDADNFMIYTSPNKLINALFQELENVSIPYPTCLYVIEHAITKANPSRVIKDVVCYIWHAKQDISQLAQDCVLLALSNDDNCEECLFVFIECIR